MGTNFFSKEGIMYNNIGKKIKGLAITVCILSILFCVGMAFYQVKLVDTYQQTVKPSSFESDDAYISAINKIKEAACIKVILWLVLGPIVSWASSFVLYGFGELVEKSSEISTDIKGIRDNVIDLNLIQKNHNQETKKYETLLLQLVKSNSTDEDINPNHSHSNES